MTVNLSKLIAVFVVVIAIAVGCGGNDDGIGAAVHPTPTNDPEGAYSVEVVSWVLGLGDSEISPTLGDPAAAPERRFRVLGGSHSEEELWGLVQAERFPADGVSDADLIMLFDEIVTGKVVEALLVTYNDPDLAIGISCAGTKPAVLLDEANQPLRAWRVSTDPIALVEVETTDLTAEEIASACVRRR